MLTIWVAVSVVCSGPPDPSRILARSLQRQFSTNVIAVVNQRDMNGMGRQRVRIWRSEDGRTLKKVLAPLRMVGDMSVDNGDRLISIWPDERLMIDAESMLKTPCDADFRMTLARRNYAFSIDSRPVIAGRPSFQVVAKPRFSELDTRRYCLDAKTSYPLRVDAIRHDGTVFVEFTTLQIEFPRALPDHCFDIPDDAALKRIRYERPRSVSSDLARSKIGIDPVIPETLPLGFEIQDMQINDTPEWRSLVLRITDGLVRANVYEFCTDGEPWKEREGSSARDRGKLRILIVSDLDPAIRKRLLGRFFPTESKENPFLNLDGPQDAYEEGHTELFQPCRAFAKIEPNEMAGDSKGQRPKTLRYSLQPRSSNPSGRARAQSRTPQP